MGCDIGLIPERITRNLTELCDWQTRISEVHPLFLKRYPVAVVFKGQFHIFDTQGQQNTYSLQTIVPVNIPVPDHVRAAFPIEAYGDSCVCIVTPEVFESLEGFAFIFHEFVHCHQADIYEQHLKATLQIAVRAKAKGDFMWEINYPFPYESSEFIKYYTLFLQSLLNDIGRVPQLRGKLWSVLDAHFAEYMIWQEWKEGFARYLENKVRAILTLTPNHGGALLPYNRVVFYEGGALFIDFLQKMESEITADLSELFTLMKVFHEKQGI